MNEISASTGQISLPQSLDDTSQFENFLSDLFLFDGVPEDLNQLNRPEASSSFSSYVIFFFFHFLDYKENGPIYDVLSSFFAHCRF
jgi:hypothetical protein